MTKKVFVIYYSIHGHVLTLAREILKGLKRSGVDAELYQFPETLSNEILTKVKAPPKASDVPFIDVTKLKEADGILFGFPTYFGMLPAQVKDFFDQCGQHWFTGALSGKYVGIFSSMSSLGGGQETTAMTCMPFFVHMGMIFVPLGVHSNLQNTTEIHGGSAWGAGTIASNRQPSKLELEIAEYQGFKFGSHLKCVNNKG